MSRATGRPEQFQAILANCLILAGLAYNGFGVCQLISDKHEFAGVDLHRRWLEHRYFWQRQNPYDVLGTSLGLESEGSRDASINPEIGPLVDGAYPPWSFTTGVVLVPPISWQAVRIYFSFLNLIALAVIIYWAYRTGHPFGKWSAFVMVGASSGLAANLFSLSAGQYTIIVNSLLIVSLLSFDKRLDIFAGLALGIAMIKPQISGLFFLAFLVKARWRVVLACIAYVLVATMLTCWWIRTNPIEMMQQMWQASHQWLGTAGGYGPLTFLQLMLGRNQLATKATFLTGSVSGLLLMFLRRHSSLLALFAIAAVLGRLWTYHGVYDNTMLVFLLVYLGVVFLRNPSKFSVAILFLSVGATLWTPVPYGSHGYLPLQIAHVVIWLVGLVTVMFITRNQAPIVNSRATSPLP